MDPGVANHTLIRSFISIGYLLGTWLISVRNSLVSTGEQSDLEQKQRWTDLPWVAGTSSVGVREGPLGLTGRCSNG